MVKVFAPVNIAWIKYMGKENGNPTNSSLSMTLGEVGTITEIKKVSESKGLQFSWSQEGYVPPQIGRDKAEYFLKNEKVWRDGFLELGFNFIAPSGHFEISTFNNVPAGTGIATSASGFAALTLAWIGVLMGPQIPRWLAQFKSSEEIRSKVAQIAKLGSGSAGRSIDGPWVEWDTRRGFHKVAGVKVTFTDFILLIDQEAKSVSSSEAHLRVMTSPHFVSRVERAETRLAQVKHALLKGDLQVLSRCVLDEALDMHDLFHTSEPPFSYLKPDSKKWMDRIKNAVPGLPSENAILTLDAGANVHLFVPESEEHAWEKYLNFEKPRVNFLKARSGPGAYYVDSGQ
ncbi:MAG: hypothetical protein H7333_02070 [Bdellovibrionales bacterium]|nr:hypothetical protein [Oligoflexia bacterium]